MSAYEPVIGLEIHVELATRTKMFCSCPVTFGEAPNTVTCPVCLGLPGSLPVINRQAVHYALKVAAALQGTIHRRSVFFRKNYFYPDLPKGYQITQYSMSLMTDGVLEFTLEGEVHRVRIERINMEEETAKSFHTADGDVLLDFNRAGIPLLEIVTYPDIRSPRAARVFLEKLRQTLRYLWVSPCDMEKGQLRVESNISVRPVGSEALGVKVELKNLNSFKAVEEALTYEFHRQRKLLEAGEEVVQETRLWDEHLRETRPMRVKEEAHDYRYFPEPDLPPLVLSEAEIRRAYKELPELPDQRKRRFIEKLGIPDHIAEVLTLEREVADYFEKVARGVRDKVLAATWVAVEILRVLKEKAISAAELWVKPEDTAELLGYVERKEITRNMAQEVFNRMVEERRTAGEIIQAEGLVQIQDTDVLGRVVEEVLTENPEVVEKYRKGKTTVVGFLIGQVMKKMKGKANPGVVKELLEKRLQEA